MEKDRGFRAIAVTALCIAILGVSVAFAAMSSTLSINGAANFIPDTWDVHFANLVAQTPTGHATVVTAPSIQSETTVISTYDVVLKAPGDSVSWTFDIVNGGSLNAKIDNTFVMPTYNNADVPNSIIKCTGTGAAAETDAATVCGGLVYSLTYTGGAAVTATDTLIANQAKNVTLTLSYPATNNTVPAGNVSITGLNISIPYIQDLG